MKQYNLGPNGGILTCANLFATRFDQVISLLQARAAAGTLGTVLVDTPGQIEIFTWSASGALVAEALAAHFRTCVVYVVDTPRCLAPQTFASNMLQAVSILYKMQLPLVLAFNKVDVVRHEFALAWMADFEAFHDAIDAAPRAGYGSDLARSLSLVLDEFYRTLASVGISAVTGEGADELQTALEAAGAEYETTYAVDLAARRAARDAEEEARRAAQLARFHADHAAAQGRDVVLDPSAPRRTGAEDSEDDEDQDQDDDDQ
jgi:translation initiation factor IF-2